jgi:hypothetical protein
MYQLKILSLLFLLFVFVSPESRAEDTSYMTDSPAMYAIAGLLIVDIGVSVSNAFSLINNEPNKLNGYFGVVTGALSLGLVAANLVAEEDDDLRSSFALVMGTAGLTSLLLGAINVRESDNKEDVSFDQSSVSIYPRHSADESTCHAAGVTSKLEESKGKRWPAARQADPRLIPTVRRH